jgi:DNA polymerase III alpha subunit (gram-positive type)
VKEVYVSTDVETDGLCAGLNSMLSLGSVAFDSTGKEIGQFFANLEALPDAKADKETMDWWAKFPEAWEKTRANAEPPVKVMVRYADWLKSLPGRAVFVGYPAAFDSMFVFYYLWRFTGENPFGHGALDIKTLAMVAMRKQYTRSVKKNMPKRWFPPEVPHTHVSVEDARSQGLLFFNILREWKEWLHDEETKDVSASTPK